MTNRYKVAFWTLLTLVLFPVVLVGGCSLTARALTEWQEIARVTSPDGTVEAVIVVAGGGLGGATSGPDYGLYLVPYGGKVEDPGTSEELLSTQSSGRSLNLLWLDERTLEIKYDVAAIDRFTNYGRVADAGGEERVVELRLAAPPDKPGLPKGLLEGAPLRGPARDGTSS